MGSFTAHPLQLQSWKGTCHCRWRVLEMCSLLSSPQDLWTCRPDSCQWWLRRLWPRLHAFYGETITKVVLRQDWASGHSSCHTYCWGVWINDQMASAGCTTLTLNCQLHCERPIVFPLFPFFHSGPEFRKINMCFLISSHSGSKQEHWEFLFPYWWLCWWLVQSMRACSLPQLPQNWNSRRPFSLLNTVSHYLVLVGYDLCHLSVDRAPFLARCLYDLPNTIVSFSYCMYVCVFKQSARFIISLKLYQAHSFLVMLILSNRTIFQYPGLKESKEIKRIIKKRRITG